MADIVDALFTDAEAVLTFLRDSKEVSFLGTASDLFRKALLVAGASRCEARIVGIVSEFVAEVSPGTPLVDEFVKNKALSRQYHTLFDWKETNANQFFGFFGVAFRDRMKQLVKSDESLAQSIRAFMELGSGRNNLVHQNFASFPLEQTTSEIRDLYVAATAFLDRLPELLRTGVAV